MREKGAGPSDNRPGGGIISWSKIEEESARNGAVEEEC